MIMSHLSTNPIRLDIDQTLKNGPVAAGARAFLALVLIGLLTACGGDESPNGSVPNMEQSTAAAIQSAPADPPAQADSASNELDYAMLCAALDVDALAALVGGSVARVESRDGTMMDRMAGHCRIFIGPNEYIHLSVSANAEHRFMLNKGGGVQTPLVDEPRAEDIALPGATRAVALWANDDFANEANNIRELVLDYNGRALTIAHGGLGTFRDTDTLIDIAEQARQDLDW
ncbi:MAG: hypothetical protein AAGH65_07800 [Pseudomonadota bacterium]